MKAQTSQAYLLQQLAATKHRASFEIAAHRGRNAQLGERVYDPDRASRATRRKLDALIKKARRLVARVAAYQRARVNGEAAVVDDVKIELGSEVNS